MADLDDVRHIFGGDLVLSVSGGLDRASAEDRSQLRVLRRLMTNPGDYIFHPTYGAGLSQLIGKAIEPAKVKALIRGQMKKEASVAVSPEPTVSVTPTLKGFSAAIGYVVAPSGVPVVLSFTVSP